ncbi:Fe-S protein assembly co-chaperone HscB [Acidovorax sp. HDW3]|uniref:Fe-S protein assembly co-chaperone HscB n=1 Tax=Acidovorax sp. HDW3 TaxID=2714923 RepID=UPI00140C44B4|nr:Fe-S protein assembly co-chaperone HscB [Acidovorax sp. HDW3]QIL44016.1 Fe-S protein assembly co-chaperone HscB [Acidovorax sp. HDW3]
MHLQSDDFELFGLPRRFAQERAQIDLRWKELQRQAHPDRFAAQGAAAQRVAMQWSVRINEAYQRLKDPQKRAAYLCELHGAPLRAEDNTAMPAAFLLQQMQWREALDDAADAGDAPALDALEREVQQAQAATLAQCAQLLDQAQDWAGAAQQVRALMFLARFVQELRKRQEQLGQ